MSAESDIDGAFALLFVYIMFMHPSWKTEYFNVHHKISP